MFLEVCKHVQFGSTQASAVLVLGAVVHTHKRHGEGMGFGVLFRINELHQFGSRVPPLAQTSVGARLL